MTTMLSTLTASRSLPAISAAHWLLRLPLATIIFYQGYLKFPALPEDVAGLGIPFILYVLSGVGELAAAVGLMVGGLLRNWMGDLLTRASAAVMALIVAAVIYMFYWGPLIGMEFHLMLLAGSVFFALRGNAA